MAVTPGPGIHLAAGGTFVPRLTRGWASPRDLAPGEADDGPARDQWYLYVEKPQPALLPVLF